MNQNNNGYIFIVRPWAPKYENLYKNVKKYWNNKIAEQEKLPRLLDFGDLPAETLFDVRQKIIESEMVVVDLSLGLPNIYWEFACALDFGKPLILLRGDEAKSRENLMAIINASDILENNQGELNKIVNRLFNIASDTNSYVYTSYNESVFTADDMNDEKINTFASNIKSLISKAVEISFKKEQTNWISKYAYKKYIDLDKNSDSEIFIYYQFADNEQSEYGFKELLSDIMDTENNNEHITMAFYRDDFACNISPFQTCIENCGQVFYCSAKSKWKIIIKVNNHAYLSHDGQKYLFIRKNNFTEFLNQLEKNIREYSIPVCTVEMLEHAGLYRQIIAPEIASSFYTDGYAFDDCTELWTESSHAFLSKIEIREMAADFRAKVQESINDAFHKFATEYLKSTRYIIAFWPLIDESLEFRMDESGAVSRWINELDDWYKKDTDKKRIDRFFTIPGDKFIFNSQSDYEINDDEYKNELVDFFTNRFKINNCDYKDHIYIIFNDHKNQVWRGIGGFQKNVILDKNVILFSKEYYEQGNDNVVYDGILQDQKEIKISNTGEKILHLRYKRIITNRQIAIGTADMLYQNMVWIRRALESKPVVFGRINLKCLVPLKEFMEKYLGLQLANNGEMWSIKLSQSVNS